MKNRIVLQSAILSSIMLAMILLVKPAYAKSEQVKQSIDTTSYQTVIEDVIRKSNHLYYGEGLLYDIDNNGTKELILLYTNNDEFCVTSIYTMSGNTVVPLLEEGELFSQAGGPNGFAGIISYNNKKYFGYYYESGETGGVGESPIRRGGGWMLYSVNGTVLTEELEVDIDFLYSNSLSKVVTGTANFNGKKATWFEYEEWLQKLVPIDALGGTEYRVSGMPLDDLLQKVRAEYPGSPSSWAADEVVSARRLNLIPDQIDGDYQRNITRENFCEMALQFLTTKTGLDSETFLKKYHLSAVNVFSDTKNPAVITMNALGIVKGVDNSHFNPDAKISREEAAVILGRICELFENISPNNLPVSFSDQAKISSWAKKSVEMVTACSYGGKRIMNGTGQNLFSPKAPYSREQAMLTILRLYNFIGNAALVDSLPGKGYVPLSIADVVGEWTIDVNRTMDANGQSLLFMFGTSIRYGYSMKFENDASCSFYIAAGIGGDGVFTISDNNINIKYKDYEQGYDESITLQTIRDESGDLIIVMPLWDADVNIFWVRS